MTQAHSLSNQFLIAMPSMEDGFFTRSVTYLCQHNADGALGIVINRPADLTLGNVLDQMNIESFDHKINQVPVFYGGPVHPERGFVIHEPVGHWDSSLRISEDIALTSSRDILEAVARGTGPRHLLVALGYAGWGKGQLEKEMLDNAWLNSPVNTAIMFEKPASQRWKAAVEAMGVNVALLSSQAGHA
ncbi:MAG: YqgE/AlgH family protein [Methylococcaceae bacterium]|nr:MAG: YqgE/AlgH family protein [Methylococcaceae bacterium]